MHEDTRQLLLAAQEILRDFDDWGEVLQTDALGEYGPTTAIERLRKAVKAVYENNNN